MTPASVAPNWRRIVLQGALAGIVGSVVLAAFLYAAFFHELHGSLAALFALDAANIHATSPWIGAVAHFCVGVAWGIGYAYLADTRPRVLSTPWLSGFIYGLVVWFIMQLVLMAGAVWSESSLAPYALISALVGHAFFYGIPVALVTRALRG